VFLFCFQQICRGDWILIPVPIPKGIPMQITNGSPGFQSFCTDLGTGLNHCCMVLSVTCEPCTMPRWTPLNRISRASYRNIKNVMKPAGLGTFFVKLTINGKNEEEKNFVLKV